METILSSCLRSVCDVLSKGSLRIILDSAAKISKSSKFIVQLHCNRRSDIADYLTFFRRFPVRLEIPMYSAAVV